MANCKVPELNRTFNNGRVELSIELYNELREGKENNERIIKELEDNGKIVRVKRRKEWIWGKEYKEDWMFYPNYEHNEFTKRIDDLQIQNHNLINSKEKLEKQLQEKQLEVETLKEKLNKTFFEGLVPRLSELSIILFFLFFIGYGIYEIIKHVI